MDHDFSKQPTQSNPTQPYVYRKYENEDKECRGLMDYIDDGVGWSKCSARDFSRYLTQGGTKNPCNRKGNLVISNIVVFHSSLLKQIINEHHQLISYWITLF